MGGADCASIGAVQASLMERVKSKAPSGIRRTEGSQEPSGITVTSKPAPDMAWRPVIARGSCWEKEADTARREGPAGFPWQRVVLMHRLAEPLEVPAMHGIVGKAVEVGWRRSDMLPSWAG